MKNQLSRTFPNPILNDNQQKKFVKNGYIGPFSLPDCSSVTKLRHRIEQSSEYERSLLMPQRFSHIISKPVFELTTESYILDGVSSLLGHNVLLWVAEVMFKTSDKGMTVWHVDEINYAVGGVHLSVAITDMNLENGCLQVIPGTHKYLDNLQEFVNKGECDRSSSESMVRLADRLHPENAPHRVVPVEMKAGQYFFTKGGLWHCAVANQTDKIRLSLVARYMRTDVNSAKARNQKDSLPCVLVRGEDNDRLNTLYKPPLSKLKIMHNILLLFRRKYRK